MKALAPSPRPCIDCGAITPRYKCVKCIQKWINDNIDPCHPFRRAKAKDVQLTEYPDYCDHHGMTMFDTVEGRCRQCRRDARRSGQPRAVARQAGLPTYEAACPTHGVTSHSVAQGKCLTCFTTAGVRRVQPGQERPRGSPETPRSAARKAGAAVFLAECPTHGWTPHHVRSGVCATCYTAAGTRRVLTRA